MPFHYFETCISSIT